jgi:hypothetical protein
MLSAKYICLLLALVCFALATFGVPKASWRDAGFGFVVLSLLV